MAYYTDRMVLVRDSMENIELFRLSGKKIIRYHFDKKTISNTEVNITSEAYKEYDVYIDQEDTIYLIYQNKDLDLILLMLKEGRVEKVKLTEDPLPEIYYLNLIVVEGVPHVFYYILLSGEEKKYRIYHHYIEEDKWITNTVDDIRVRELLNPLAIHIDDVEILMAYYDYVDEEHIFLRKFNLDSKTWEERNQLTDNSSNKLYLDLIDHNNKLHLVYCQYEGGNLQVKYERYQYEKDLFRKECEEEISNLESPQDPTLIYFDGKLWITWIERDAVLSRFSEDGGDSWSPIYLWKDSKRHNIVRYKYLSNPKDNNTLLNYSFGKFSTDLSFVGFGPLKNTEVIPLKKKESFEASQGSTKNKDMIEDIIMELEKIYETIDKLNKRISKLEEYTINKEDYKNDIINTVKRVEDIEEYLTIRSRGYFRRFIGK